MKTRLAALAVTVLTALALVFGLSVSSASATVNNSCSSLGVSLGRANGAAGSLYVPIRFTNTSGHTCRIFGFPGVSLTRANHTQIGLSAARDYSVAEPHVTLAPGHYVSAILRIVNAGNYPPSVCAPVTSSFLRVIAPDKTLSHFLPFHKGTCSKPIRTLFIRPV